MSAQFSINLSESKYSKMFFDGLISDPSNGFMKIHTAIVQKDIKNVTIQFNQEIQLYRAAENNTLQIEISQRRGYKNVLFYC